MINPGDEVIILAPYWVSYIEQIKLAEGVPIVVDTVSTDFKINFNELKSKISPKTRLIIINSPQNPSGVVYTQEELKSLADLVLQYKNVYVLSDEIYEKLIFDNLQHVSLAQINEEIKERTIIVNGLSKTYSMTGWRIGYLVAPEIMAKAIGTLQSHSTSNPTTFCQTASVTAIEQHSKEVDEMIDVFKKRRDYIYQLLSEIKGFQTIKPQGAFYIYPNINGIIGKKYKGHPITDDLSFAEILLKEKKVALVPGSGFGTKNFIRLSFATSEKNIEKGLVRIKEFVEELQ